MLEDELIQRQRDVDELNRQVEALNTRSEHTMVTPTLMQLHRRLQQIQTRFATFHVAAPVSSPMPHSRTASPPESEDTEHEEGSQGDHLHVSSPVDVLLASTVTRTQVQNTVVTSTSVQQRMVIGDPSQYRRELERILSMLEDLEKKLKLLNAQSSQYEEFSANMGTLQVNKLFINYYQAIFLK